MGTYLRRQREKSSNGNSSSSSSGNNNNNNNNNNNKNNNVRFLGSHFVGDSAGVDAAEACAPEASNTTVI